MNNKRLVNGRFAAGSEQLKDQEWLIAEYQRTQSTQLIAEQLGVGRGTVRNQMVIFGIPRRPPGSFKGVPKSPDTRERMSKAQSAYRASHPQRNSNRLKVSMTKTNGRGYTIQKGYRRVIDLRKRRGSILEHRLLMEIALGRALLPDETVHHRNGDRANNSFENLELWSHHQPRGQRVRDKLEWAYEIIRRYGELPPEIQ